MQRIFKAAVETRHFSFEGYGASENEAMEALSAVLRIHETQYPVADGFIENAMADSQLNEIVVGGGYRDSELLTSATPPRPKG
jgi:hypothetical protein